MKKVSGKLKVSKKFRPCPVEEGDELYQNGIFVFNVAKMLEFINDKPNEVVLDNVDVESVRTGFPKDHLDESTIENADISKPIILAEIRPGGFNVIDGNHRLEKAYRLGRKQIGAYRFYARQHIGFLTTEKGYVAYVQYWNEKLKSLIDRC